MAAPLANYADCKPSGSPWIGSVPSHWTVRSFGSLITPRNLRNRPELPLLSVAREKGVFVRNIESDSENHNVIPEDLSNYKVAMKGDLVINKMKAWQGSMGISPVDGIVSPAYFVYRFRIDNPEFGKYLLRSKPYISHFAQASDGVRIGQWDLTIHEMKRIPILLPPPQEQDAIVQFLDWANRRFDRAIRAKKKLIALLNEQKRRIIHRAVTQGINPDAKMKDSGIAFLGWIPVHWETPPLKGICKIQSGITLGNQYGSNELAEYKYLRVANVQSGHVNLSVVKSVLIPIQVAQRSTLEKGDVLMTEGGDADKLGRGCVWNDEISPCLHQNHVFAIRPIQEKIGSRYFSMLLNSYYSRDYFQSTSKQTTNLASTNKTTIGRFRIPLPKIGEQETILKAIDGFSAPISDLISNRMREVEYLREYQISFVANVITGKLDVREAASRLPSDILNSDEPEDALDPEALEEETPEDIAA